MKCPKKLYDRCIMKRCPYYKDCPYYDMFIDMLLLSGLDW